MSVPLIWGALLWQRRKRLNPPISNFADVKTAIEKRNEDDQLKPFAFLFSVYKPAFYWFEPAEMYRRVMFVGVLPLMSGRVSRRAAIGIALALLSAVAYREVEPFGRSSTNVLVHVAQYSILLTFSSALAIETNLSKGIDAFGFGLMLVAVNLVILGIALALGAYRHYLDGERLWKWMRPLNEVEMQVIDAVMGANGPRRSRSPTESPGAKILRQHTFLSKDVVLQRRIGKGAFGEVFLGSCFGAKVAVKTVLEVSEATMMCFRAEILLTATLRHPCVVNFCGCCWGKDLTCLVLEWVAKGSLGDLLGNGDGGLSWDGLLLQLVADVARGLHYLHEREFYDEADECHKRCVIHRDLKPDNVLISEFDRAKVADFGNSEALVAGGKSWDAAGTPLFASPEIMKAEAHDGKADVFSFGMLLVDCCAPEGVHDFVAARWRRDHVATLPAGRKGAKSNRNAVLRAIAAACSEKWRAVKAGDFGLPSAPPAVCALIVRCLEHDPTDRPDFEEILRELTGACTLQIEAGRYVRGGGEANPEHPAEEAGPHSRSADPEAGAMVGGEEDLERRKSEAILRNSLAFRTSGLVGDVVASSGRRRKSTTTEQIEMTSVDGI